MTWHLKDRDLEKKLIKTCPNFIECIEDAIQTKEKDTNYIYVEFDREREGDTLGFNYLYFWDDELEEVPEYNPNDWNEFPTVDPPLDVLMRVELSNGMKYGAIFKRFGNEYSWCYADGSPTYESFTESVTRYRPWED